MFEIVDLINIGILRVINSKYNIFIALRFNMLNEIISTANLSTRKVTWCEETFKERKCKYNINKID